VEVARAVRPRDVATIEAGLAGIDGGAGDGTASP
jgi:hypothetical protein